MSKLDFPTIIILVICIAAIIFLGYKLFGLLDKSKQPTDTPTEVVDGQTSEPVEEDSLYLGEGIDSTGMAVSDDEDEAHEGEDELSDPDTMDGGQDTDIPEAYEGDPTGKYMVLAGAFSLRHNAENYAAKLKDLGYDNVAVKTFNRGKLAVVLVDRFESLNSAKRLVSELEGKGIEAYVQTQRASSN